MMGNDEKCFRCKSATSKTCLVCFEFLYEEDDDGDDDDGDDDVSLGEAEDVLVLAEDV